MQTEKRASKYMGDGNAEKMEPRLSALLTSETKISGAL